MEFITNETVATARPRALSPSTRYADWSSQRPALTDMRDQSVVLSLTANHNSITRTAPVAVSTVPATGLGFGAAKQAAPPRGVPR